MLLREFKKWIRSAQQGPFAKFVAVSASLQQSFKHRSPVHIYLDKEGCWHNKRRDATFVTPQLHALSLDAVERAVLDQWCYAYTAKRGDIVVDVGAGVGDDALIFSKFVGPTGCVIAIEAHPQTYSCLLKTITLNGLKNVIAVNAAVSDHDGEIFMEDGSSYKANRAIKGNSGVSVKARRLDDILSELAMLHPNMVKMNIEGAETAALNGMSQTLNSLPNIVVSCHDFIADAGGDLALRTYEQVEAILQRSGYDVQDKRQDDRLWIPYYIYGVKHRKL